MRFPSLSTLRKMDTSQIISEFATSTRAAFKELPGVPTIIPSRNEERDIASCLVALSRSEFPILPLVIVNGSTDNTAEIAEKLGALVYEENNCKKMGATQKGIELAIQINPWKNSENRVLLFTDADTLVPKKWSSLMHQKVAFLLRTNLKSGVAIFGSSLYLHGPSYLADIGQCYHGFYADIRQWILHKPPLARGHNYALGLDSSDKVISAINSLNPYQVYRDDVSIYETLTKQGVKTSRYLNPLSFVWTRGDRAASFQEFLKNVFIPGYEERTYKEQYGPDSSRYSGSNESPV